MTAGRATRLTPPYLKRIGFRPDVALDRAAYPMSLPLFRRDDFEVRFERPVTIFVGENGVGKSTLLEGVAAVAGFDRAGGGPGYRPLDHDASVAADGDSLERVLRASWLPKVGQGWFFRAESFFSVARYLDQAAREAGAAPPDFLSHSHGESFLRFFAERCARPGLFLFDEPESALSPGRQFEFLKLLRSIQTAGRAQVVIVTHSPIIMALPDVQLLSVTRGGIDPVRLDETDHFRLWREFMLDPHGTTNAMLDA